jgi:hypothetical protein
VTKVDWESLPTKRDPKQVEYKSYSYKSYGYSTYDKEYKKYDNSWSGWDKSPSKRSRRKNYGYCDDFYFEDSDHCTPAASTYSGMDKTGRAFLDDLDNDFTDEYYGNYQYKESDKFHYESLKQELYKDTFTKDERQIIKEQYLDVSDYYDDEFVNDFMNDGFSI